MPRSASFAGVILAAGESSRMGRDKALLPWPSLIFKQTIDEQMNGEQAAPSGQTFLSAAIRSFASTDFVIVVAGKNVDTLSPIVYSNGGSLVINPDPDRGQFSSLRVGLTEVLNRGRDTAVITLVDRPPAKATTVQALREAFEAASREVWALVPEFAGKHGHPYIAGREMIEQFLRAPETSNAREIEHAAQEHIQYLTVDDPFVALNINTPEDYRALTAKPA